jgi:hypothetical protein
VTTTATEAPPTPDPPPPPELDGCTPAQAEHLRAPVEGQLEIGT